jgi:hypothetical protein
MKAWPMHLTFILQIIHFPYCYINVTDSIKTALSTLVPAKQSPNSLFKNLVEVFYFFKSSLTSL